MNKPLDCAGITGQVGKIDIKIHYRNGEQVTKKLTRAECDEILADLDGHPHVEKVEYETLTT